MRLNLIDRIRTNEKEMSRNQKYKNEVFID